MTEPENYEYKGLLASTWDLLRGDTSGWEDRPYFREVIARYGQPALDVGCSTGRLLLDYLASGIDLDGVDLSPEMLAICREKAAAQGLAPALYQQGMDALSLPRRYRTIFVSSSSIQLLLQPGAAALGMRRFRAHLAPGGALAAVFMRLWTPDDPLDSGWKLLQEATRPEDGAVVRRWNRSRYDPQARLEHTEDRFEIVMEGVVTASELHQRSPATREYTQAESIALFEQAGFAQVQAYRGWSFEPAGEGDWLWTVIGVNPGG
jgi:SAM-dependent methyltransferase